MEWKPIPGFEMYEISSAGQIKRTRYSNNRKGHELKQARDKDGYMRCVLWKDGKGYARKVHRLLAIAFLGENTGDVNHKNGIRDDNRIENVEWVSHLQNMRHSFRDLGRVGSLKGKTGKQHPRSIPVRQMKGDKIVSEYVSARDAHKKTGINHANINECCRGNRKTAGGYKWEYVWH